MRVLAPLVLILATMGPVLAQDAQPLGERDWRAIRSTIEGQLEAFRRDDADLAFGYAAPTIRTAAGTAGNFMKMVINGYYPIYRARGVTFGRRTVIAGSPVQLVSVVGPKGTLYDAFYIMERQFDGTWRIGGVKMVESKDERT